MFEETAVFLNDFGKACKKFDVGPMANDILFLGIFNMPGSLVTFGDINVVSEDYSLIYASADVALAEKDVVNVEGANYKVYEKMPIDDGVFSQVRMRRT